MFGTYTPLTYFFLALSLAAFVVEAWAFIDAITRPSQAFVASGKQTKPLWLIILGVAAVIGLAGAVYGVGPTSILPVVLTPGGRVEVRPVVQVSGRIVDASGAAYLVNPYRLDGRVYPAPPVTVWDNFTPGSYQLFVTTSGGEVAYPFTVAESQTTTVVVK